MFFDTFQEEYYIKHTSVCLMFKESIALNEKWQSCTFDDITIGDYIYVEYTPSSQRYIYTHVPECGKVTDIVFVKCEFTNTNNKHIFINNHNDENTLINKDGFCMYSSGYEMNILKKI